jgi:hypothetical protein
MRRGKEMLGIHTSKTGSESSSEIPNSPSVKARFKGFKSAITAFSKRDSDMGSQGSLHKLDSPKVEKKLSPLSGGSMMGTAQKAQMLQSKRPRSASNLLSNMQLGSDSSLAPASASSPKVGVSSGSNTESPPPSPLQNVNSQSKHFPSSYRMSTLSKSTSMAENVEVGVSETESFIERELENVISQEELIRGDREADTDDEKKDGSTDPAQIQAFEEKYLGGCTWKAPQSYPTTSPTTAAPKIHPYVLLKLHVPEESPVIVKVTGETVMEAYCRKLCTRKNLEYDLYSFETGQGQDMKPVEMDARAGSLFTPMHSTDVHLVKKAKVYTSISTYNSSEETVISNLVDGKYVIMASKKEIIFDLMASVEFEDEKFSNVIFLTFRSFSTPLEFLEYLILSFYSKLGEGGSPEEAVEFQKHKVPTQLKILRVLHKWIEHHWHDFGLDSRLRTTLQIFLNKVGSHDGEFSEVGRGLLFVADIQVLLNNAASVV